MQNKNINKVLKDDQEVFEAYFKKIHEKQQELRNLDTFKNNGTFSINKSTHQTKLQERKKKIQELEKEVKNGKALMKIFLLVASGHLQTRVDKNSTLEDETNKNYSIPVASQLNHGSRIVFKGSPNDIDNVMKWINEDKEVPEKTSSQKKAWDNNSIIFRRTAATHDYKKDDNGTIKEIKVGKFKALLDWLGNWWNNSKNTNHFGFNVALGHDTKKVATSSADGAHGHVYIHRKDHDENTATIAFGIEAFEPNNSKHSKLGNSEKLSAGGGEKPNLLQTKYNVGVNHYFRNKYNGAEAEIPQKFTNLSQKIDSFMQAYFDKPYKPGLASIKPQENFKQVKTSFDQSKTINNDIKAQTTKIIQNIDSVTADQQSIQINQKNKKARQI
jgi:hypothetical protein